MSNVKKKPAKSEFEMAIKLSLDCMSDHQTSLFNSMMEYCAKHHDDRVMGSVNLLEVADLHIDRMRATTYPDFESITADLARLGAIQFAIMTICVDFEGPIKNSAVFGNKMMDILFALIESTSHPEDEK